MSRGRPSRREVAAAATRREILDAARRLFAEHGYASTSVQQIAAESGVAVQTIYSSVGSKAALVLALNDLIDEEAGVAELTARVLLSAEPSEPEAAAVVADGMRRHEQGASRMVQRLAALGALRAGTTPERAGAAFSMMTSPASWRQLTDRAGWSFDEAEAWLVVSLTQLLLEQSRPPAWPDTPSASAGQQPQAT
jgi:AcrR family transcriptional regulator